jgi:hypothetical protein
MCGRLFGSINLEFLIITFNIASVLVGILQCVKLTTDCVLVGYFQQPPAVLLVLENMSVCKFCSLSGVWHECKPLVAMEACITLGASLHRICLEISYTRIACPQLAAMHMAKESPPTRGKAPLVILNAAPAPVSMTAHHVFLFAFTRLALTSIPCNLEWRTSACKSHETHHVCLPACLPGRISKCCCGYATGPLPREQARRWQDTAKLPYKMYTCAS